MYSVVNATIRSVLAQRYGAVAQWYSYHVLETISAEDAWLQVLCGLQITNIALCVHAISCPNVMHNHITGSRLVFVAENQKFGH